MSLSMVSNHSVIHTVPDIRLSSLNMNVVCPKRGTYFNTYQCNTQKDLFHLFILPPEFIIYVIPRQVK